MTPTRESILSALAALGDDPATGLRERGVRGVKGDCHACPVAVYLLRALGVQFDILSVGPGCVTLYGATVARFVALPPAVAQFVLRFDRDEYPDLVS